MIIGQKQLTSGSREFASGVGSELTLAAFNLVFSEWVGWCVTCWPITTTTLLHLHLTGHAIMPYSNLVFITMNWIKFMGQEMKSRTRRIRFPDPHLLNQSSFYSTVHCPLLCSPKFSNQETLPSVLTVTSTWMFLNITYNGSWDICNMKLSQSRSQLLMAPLQLQWQLRSLRFLLMAFISNCRSNSWYL